MNIAEFAESYRVRTRKDEAGETVIFGKLWKVQPITEFNRQRNPERVEKLHYRHLVFDYGDGRFGLLLQYPVDNDHEIGGSGKTAKLAFAKKKLIAAGFTIRQEGDAECIALFDPEDKAQSRLALKMAGVRLRREMSQEQRIAAAERLATIRKAAA